MRWGVKDLLLSDLRIAGAIASGPRRFHLEALGEAHYGASSSDYGRFLTAATRRGLADDLTRNYAPSGAAPGVSTAATMLWPELGVQCGLGRSGGGEGVGGSYVFGFSALPCVVCH